jgi:hypothetical protein
MEQERTPVASSQPSPEGGAATIGAQEAPLTKSELAAVVGDLLEAKLRGLQSGTDKQIARLHTEMASRIESLADELGGTARGLVEASTADPDTKEAVLAKLSSDRQAAQGRFTEQDRREASITAALRANGLDEKDLPHSVASYAKHPDPSLVTEAIERAAAKKAPAPVATAADKRIADMEAEIRRLKGDDVVPEGAAGGGVTGRVHESANDWTPEEVKAMMKRRGLST